MFHEIEIGNIEGFTNQNDIFQYEGFAKKIENFFELHKYPSTISVDAPWGAGKSVFAKQIASELRKNSFPVVEFDAFKHDFSDDPFSALVNEIQQFIKAECGDNVEFIDASKKTIIHFISNSPKLLMNAGINFILGEEGSKDAKKIAEEATALAYSSVESIIDERFKSYAEEEKILEDFKSALSNVKHLYREAKHVEIGCAKPLIIIVDELDRCRPNYAIEVLEKTKHLFLVENIHFLFLINKKQLEVSIKHAYGAETDSKTYLQKFLNIELKLPLFDEGTVRNKTFITYIDKIPNIGDDGFTRIYKDLLKALVDVGYIKNLRELNFLTFYGSMIYSVIFSNPTTNSIVIDLKLLFMLLCVVKKVKNEVFLNVQQNLSFKPLYSVYDPDEIISRQVNHLSTNTYAFNSVEEIVSIFLDHIPEI